MILSVPHTSHGFSSMVILLVSAFMIGSSSCERELNMIHCSYCVRHCNWATRACYRQATSFLESRPYGELLVAGGTRRQFSAGGAVGRGAEPRHCTIRALGKVLADLAFFENIFEHHGLVMFFIARAEQQSESASLALFFE